ncbi:hypothetical protein ACROYT_G033190 [Oculina patagonica]
MAKKRSESAKAKEDNTKKTFSASRGSVNSKSNAISARNSRSTTTRARSAKRDLKSTDVCSKSTSVNQGDSKDIVTEKGPSRHGKKRNTSLQESSESPVKKPKVEYSKVQTQKDAQITEDDKRCSLQEQRKSAALSKQAGKNGKEKNEIKSLAGSSCKQEVHNATTGKGKRKQKQSPLKHKHVATPEDIQKSPRKDKVVGKKLRLDSIGSEGEGNTKDNLNTGEKSSSDESSDDEGVAWEDVDEANVVDHVLEGHTASTSHHHQSPSKKNVEISITVPGAKKRKKGWSQEDVMKFIKRAVNRFRKDVFIRIHKVHLLTLIAHGFFRNGVCNEPLLQAVLLSHVPSEFLSGNKRKWDVLRLTNFLKWFQNNFSSTDDAKTGDKETDKQIAKLQNLPEVFVTILRALGFLTRLVYSLQPMSAKGDVDSKTSPKTTKKKTLKGSNTATKNTPEGSAKKTTQPKKQKNAIKPKNVKTENEMPTAKSVMSSPENKIGHHTDELNIKKQTKEDVKKESDELTTAKSDKKIRNRNGKGNKTVTEVKSDAVDKPSKQNTRKRPLRKRQRVDYSSCGNENGSDADEEWNEQSSDSEDSEDLNNSRENSKRKDKTPLARKKVPSTDSESGTPNGGSGISFVDLLDDDSDFEVTSKPLVKRRVSAGSSGSKKKSIKILSSDESDESVKCLRIVYNEQDINWWTEVYLPVDKKWICVHLESSSVNHPELCEKQATQPLVYVVSFDNKNAVKDVTNRYASSWMSKTRKLRIDSDWWEDTLQPYKSRNKKMDQVEDSHLEDQLLDKPLPTSITEFKNHPLYVLKRHLLKFEAIYPETAAILGYCRGEAVYSRECLHTLHTREKWLNEALVVKQGEKAYKIVKGRPKRNQPIHERDSVTIDLFGRWQTEKYKPPPAKDGKVPRNEYGNVELFLPCMLPPGTKHIQISGIQRVAKKLGIDCAQAVVGFDFHCGFSHPVIDGVVVCEEFEQVLLEAWQEEEEQAEKRKAEKREKRMLANWRLLTRSLLIRERLKKRYDTEETSMAEASTSAQGNDDDSVTDTSVSWPLNRQEGKASVGGEGHCHVFPKTKHKKDPVTGEWTKSCSCGLTLPFEKM